MPTLVSNPTRIPVPGNKLIEEYIGHVNSGDGGVSVAHMHSPPGWSEPGQQPGLAAGTAGIGRIYYGEVPRLPTVISAHTYIPAYLRYYRLGILEEFTGC